MTKTKAAAHGFTALPETYRAYASRGLSEETMRRYKKFVGKEDDPIEARSPIYDCDNNHIGNKLRYLDKSFSLEPAGGDLLQRAGLYGRHAFPAGSAKAITVTEGNEDAEAAFEMMGSKYPCVSVHSASSALKDIKRDFEYLNSFDTIVLAFDNDEPGQKAAKACAQAGFAVGKVKILTLRKHKDANDYKKARDNDAFLKEWWQAPTYRPDGLRLGSEIIEDILSKPNHFTVDYPWDPLNKMTYGLRLSELVLLMADTGAGKTTVMKEMAYKFLMDPSVKENNYGVGFLHLEEPVYDTGLGLLSIHDNLPYHLPDTPKNPEDIRKAHREVLGDDRAVFYDAFGSNDVDVIVDKVRHMSAMGCKFFFLDHLSIIVAAGDGDDRKELDAISTKLKMLTVELDIAIVCVIHQNRSGQARGSAGPEQVANLHIAIFRDKEDRDEWRRNVIKLVIKKSRFSGRTGPALWLWYNPLTGRLSPLDDEQIARYEEGGSMREDELW